MEVGHTHPAVQTWGSSECLSEGARESLERSVVRVQGDVRDRVGGVRQLIGCPLQEQPPSHRRRSLINNCAEQPVELRAALVNLPREITCGCVSVQRVDDYFWEPICRAPILSLIHVQKSSFLTNHKQR